jgi:hypothetical protein
MLRKLRARIHLALNLEPRGDLAGFNATIFVVLAGIAALFYLGNYAHPFALLVALTFANVAILSLFLPATRKKRSWRRDGIHLIVVLAHLFAGRLLVRYLAGLSVDWDLIEYLVCVLLAVCLVWQVAHRFFWRPRAFEQQRAAEALGWYREEFPRL